MIEVFPPIFAAASEGRRDLRVESSVESFVADVRAIRGYADVILVASLKRPGLLKLPTIDASILLREKLGVDAAPVIVVRDQDRLRFLSTVVTGLSGGLKSMMIVWGDSDWRRRVPSQLGFPGLSGALKEASQVRDRARSQCRFLAPVDLRRLFTSRGVSLAKERLDAGAGLLLAQPPTTDPAETFDSHANLIEKSGLEGKVLPNVFPFKDSQDVSECEKYFGWRLPKKLHEAAHEGESSLLGIEREVVRRLRSEHFPGVYVSTRGTPALARDILA